MYNDINGLVWFLAVLCGLAHFDWFLGWFKLHVINVRGEKFICNVSFNQNFSLVRYLTYNVGKLTLHSLF